MMIANKIQSGTVSFAYLAFWFGKGQLSKWTCMLYSLKKYYF